MALKKLLFIWTLTLWALSLPAQVTGYGLGDFYNTHMGSKYGKIADTNSGIKGSPYENERFIPGEVFTNAHLHYSGVPLRYNIYSDLMEFSKPGEGIFEIAHPETIDSILIGASRYLYLPFKNTGKTKKGYFKALNSGYPMLLLKLSTILNPAVAPGAYKDPVPPTFERTKDSFYLLFPDGEALIFSNKKEFLSILPSFRTETEQFIQKNKTRFNNQEDMIRLIDFYSSLTRVQNSP